MSLGLNDPPSILGYVLPIRSTFQHAFQSAARGQIASVAADECCSRLLRDEFSP
ncbi:hypothetical protein [Altericista sp. CCNU0014]|uniref:hypothetical protein n=1 Tax=Altericista sp. CCNU0014 TaxID=3082949 RepID=UPI00384FE31F